MSNRRFNEGVRAFKQNQPRSDNPYEPDSEWAIYWDEGWLDAQLRADCEETDKHDARLDND